MESKYLTDKGEIDAEHLLSVGLKPSEVAMVFCKEHHSMGPCKKCGWTGLKAGSEKI